MAVDSTGLQRQIRQMAERAAQGAARELASDLRASAPVDTGQTRARTQVRRVAASPSTIRYTAESTTPQARYTDQGTRAHVIRPRRARVLRFNVGGRTIYAMRVNHPGTRATKWFTSRVTALRWAVLLGRNWRQ